MLNPVKYNGTFQERKLQMSKINRNYKTNYFFNSNNLFFS
jgi:hypothetical protein